MRPQFVQNAPPRDKSIYTVGTQSVKNKPCIRAVKSSYPGILTAIYCPQQIRAMSACFDLSQGYLVSEYPHCTAVISCWCGLSETLISYCIRHKIAAAPRREPQITRYTCSYWYYREDSSATPQVKRPERDQALREKYAYIKKRWLTV